MNAAGRTCLQILMLALAFMLAWLPGRAEKASGDYQFDLPAEAVIWDISGDYAWDTNDLSTRFTLNVDSAGRISGQGVSVLDDGVNQLQADVTYRGTIRSAGGITRVTMLSNIHGTGLVSNNIVSFIGTVRKNLEIDPLTGEMIGSANGKIVVTMPQVGTESEIIPLSEEIIALPANRDGGAQLALDIVPLANRYSGAATLQLAGGRTFPLALMGSYTTNTGVSSLSLKGGTNAPGVNFRLTATVTNSQLAIRSLTGRVLGQNVAWSPLR